MHRDVDMGKIGESIYNVATSRKETIRENGYPLFTLMQI